MSFIAVVEDFAFSVRRDGKDLTLIARSNVERSVGRESNVPDVLGFRIEKDRFLAARRNTVNLTVGRGADIQHALVVESDGLSRKFARLKYRGWLAAGVEFENFRWRTTRRVGCALRVELHGPQVRRVSV